MIFDSLKLLINKKLGVTSNVDTYYKLVDFKPAYGKIFEDYLQDSIFWGHTDIDLVYGEISKFTTNKILEKYDIISNHEG